MIFNPATLKYQTEADFYTRLKRAYLEDTENADKLAVFLQKNIEAGVINKKIMCSGDSALTETEWEDLVTEVGVVAASISAIKLAEEQKETALAQLNEKQKEAVERAKLEQGPGVELEPPVKDPGLGESEQIGKGTP